MALKDFNSTKIRNFRYDAIGAESGMAQTFEDEHSGTTVTGNRDKILEMFLAGDPDALEVKEPATIFDDGVGSIAIGPQTFSVNNPAGMTTITGKRDKILEMFLVGDPLNLKDEATIFDDTVGSGTTGQNYIVRHSSYEVTGQKKPIGSLIDGVIDQIQSSTAAVEAGLSTPQEAAVIIGNSGFGFGQIMMDIPPIPTPQSYEVQHRGGTATVTGLQGSIAFDDLDELKSKSVLVSTWANLVDNEQLFSYMKRGATEGYPGHNENVVNTLNFGVNSVDSTPERNFTQSPRIGYTVQLQRGGSNAEKVADNWGKLLGGAGNMWTRFINKRFERQAYFHIMQGTTDSGSGDEAEFGTFDPIGLQAGFYPGVRGISIGSAIFGKPSYIKNTPKLDNETYTDVTKFGFVNYQTQGEDMGSFEPSEESKLLYLYRNFILVPNDTEGPGGFWAMAAAYWDANSVDDRNPIVPSRNVVNSITYTDLNTVYNGGLLDAESVEDKRQYISNVFNGEITEDGEWDDNYGFFSRYKPTTPIYDNLEENLASFDSDLKHKPGLKHSFEGPEGDKLFPAMDGVQEIQKIPQVLERSREGDQTLNKYNKAQTHGFQTGLAHKYATLGYAQLNEANKYGQSLISPSEQLDLAQREVLEAAGIIKHVEVKDNDSRTVLLPQDGTRSDGQDKIYAIGRQGAKIKTTFDTNLEGPFAGSPVKTVDGKYFYDGVDKVNSQKLIERKDNTLNEGGAQTIGKASKDFIPLNFYDIHNNTDIPFRASFDGDIEDSIQPTWSPTNFVGRPVAGYTYQGTERSLSFSFIVYPKTKQEFPVLLEKVNYLVGLCYPNLDSFYRMSGPMIRLTVGDIVHDQMGFLSECSVTFPEDSTWETDDGLRFTKKINISISFQYIGDNLPLNRGAHYNLGWLNNNGAGQSYNDLQNTTAEQAGALRNKAHPVGDFLDSESVI
jgi:hypothetical protein